MKKYCLNILSLLLCLNLSSQASQQLVKVDTTYYSKLYPKKISLKRKATFREVNAVDEEGVKRYELWNLKLNRLHTLEQWKGDKAVGKWYTTQYDGSSLERDFDQVKYGSGKKLPKELDEITTMPVYLPSDSNGIKVVIAETLYPAEARDAGISGVVYLQLVVEADGRVSDVVILRGVHPYLDFEAYRVASLFEQYEVPAQRNGKEVPYYINFPIRFQLR